MKKTRCRKPGVLGMALRSLYCHGKLCDNYSTPKLLVKYMQCCRKENKKGKQKSSENPAEEEMERVYEPLGMEVIKTTKPFELTEHGPYELTETEVESKKTPTADNPFSKVAGYKINSEKSVAFLFTNDEVKKNSEACLLSNKKQKVSESDGKEESRFSALNQINRKENLRQEQLWELHQIKHSNPLADSAHLKAREPTDPWCGDIIVYQWSLKAQEEISAAVINEDDSESQHSGSMKKRR
ncbi:hypothetical protein STEG23_037004 [Scotinomys teguina]